MFIWQIFNSRLKNKYDNYLILSLLIVDESNDYEYFCHKYKVSNKIKNKFKNISKKYENLKNKKFYSEENIKKLIYKLGKDSVIDLLFFSLCIKNKMKTSDIEQLLDYVNRCEIPKFPISGDNLKEYGYATGEALGKKLKSLEEKWVEKNFIMDQKEIKKLLKKSIKN